MSVVVEGILFGVRGLLLLLPPSVSICVSIDYGILFIYLFIMIRYMNGVPPPKVCPCGDLTGSGRDLAWFSGV